ncbi:hypothetical protein HCX48_02915 [Rhodocyclus tenuis]|uniref:Uncharacterized protein n=1 Tax=Rhodocyclus gracilis TaxID=2929842 RepID=A0ABX0WI94_9RHOO|nr:DUF6691 family protein [Rhodocyclus gracilis]NJA88173.1 hypothetical protein [Rhodocyclus gracilis]
MTSPLKVFAFLDATGKWDPALPFVLGGTVVIAAISFHWILKRQRPAFHQQFHLNPPPRSGASAGIGAVRHRLGNLRQLPRTGNRLARGTRQSRNDDFPDRTGDRNLLHFLVAKRRKATANPVRLEARFAKVISLSQPRSLRAKGVSTF